MSRGNHFSRLRPLSFMYFIYKAMQICFIGFWFHFLGIPSKVTFYSAFFVAIILAHFAPLNIFQTWPILKTNYQSDHISAQFECHPDQMVRSRCTPIKLQISTHWSLSPSQSSLKALKICVSAINVLIWKIQTKNQRAGLALRRENQCWWCHPKGEKKFYQ